MAQALPVNAGGMMKAHQRSFFRSSMAVLLAARNVIWPKRRLPITKLSKLFATFPADFNLTIVDVGSIGGLHRRWKPLRAHLTTLNFDPLDSDRGSERERFFPLLLGAADGQASLLVTRRGSMSSTLPPNRDFYSPFWSKPDDIEVVKTLSARSTTLDALAEAEGLWPDALKIDVQGGEGAVLQGSAQALDRSVLLAEVECSFAERYEGQKTIDQVMQFMRERGFALLDLRRLKRYRYRNVHQVADASLGRGMRAGRLAFCDAIFVLEPDRLWNRMSAAGDKSGEIGLRMIALTLAYGKPDLAAAVFDRLADALPQNTRDALDDFFSSLAGDGGWVQQLHYDFDAWAQRV
jgi:FkbM family methyltransferase